MAMVEGGTRHCACPATTTSSCCASCRGKDVRITHGLAETLEQLECRDAASSSSRSAEQFIDGLVSHYVLDDGKLVVAHAGMKEALQGRGSGRVREFALYGETTGETDEFGLAGALRLGAPTIAAAAMVVYGHTPVPEPEWLNRTISIDTGCVFGGELTALRYPERELVSVPARADLLRAGQAASARSPRRRGRKRSAEQTLLDIDDVLGKRVISTRLRHTVTIREENAAAALEVMSRFAVDPRWLIYLPPTMSPPETGTADGE